jgi:hypothetical protein
MADKDDKKYEVGFEPGVMGEIIRAANRAKMTPESLVPHSIEVMSDLVGKQVILRDKRTGAEYDYVPGSGRATPRGRRSAPELTVHEGGGDSDAEEAGGRPACFPGDTLIGTPDGERRIDRLKAGDAVLSFAGAKGLVTAKILKVKAHGERHITKLVFDDGSALRITASHTLLTSARWRPWCSVRRIRVGDKVVSVTGPRRVVGISPDGIERVFKLITTGPHNFVAGGVIAHNFTVLRRTRAWLHRIGEAFPVRRPHFWHRSGKNTPELR